MIVSDSVFINGFFIILIISIFSTLFVLYQFKKNTPLDPGTQFLFVYFMLGTVSFIGTWYSISISNEINLSVHFGIATLCAMFLLLALMNEKLLSIRVKTILGIHALLFVLIFVEPETTTLIIVNMIHSVIVYSLIAWLSFKRFKSERNFGYGIILVAVLLIPIPILFHIPSMFNHFDGGHILGLLTILYGTGFTLICVGFLSTNLVDENKKLELLSIKDPLTGLFNRRGLEQSLALLLPSIKRNKQSLSAIALDIDHFKKINDNYGHDCGDIVLREIAQLIKMEARESDACCRAGGEEFVIIMPNTDQNEAVLIADRLRMLIENHNLSLEQESFKLTSSFGVATQNEEIKIDYLFKQADKALYLAKERGRNRVEIPPSN